MDQATERSRVYLGSLESLPVFSTPESSKKKIRPRLEEIIQEPYQYPDLKFAINALNQRLCSIDDFYNAFYHNGILRLARSLEPIARVSQLSLPRLNNHIVYRSDADGFSFAKCHQDDCLEPDGRHIETEWLSLPHYSMAAMNIKNGHFVSINPGLKKLIHTESHLADMNEYTDQLLSYLRLLDRFCNAEPRLFNSCPDDEIAESYRYKLTKQYQRSQNLGRLARMWIRDSAYSEDIGDCSEIRQIDCTD